MHNFDAGKKIDEVTVAHLAKLSRLRLSTDETTALTAELGQFLGFARALDALTLDDVPAATHAVITQAPVQADLPAPASELSQRVLAGAPASVDTAFSVPTILAGD